MQNFNFFRVDSPGPPLQEQRKGPELRERGKGEEKEEGEEGIGEREWGSPTHYFQLKSCTGKTFSIRAHHWLAVRLSWLENAYSCRRFRCLWGMSSVK